MMLTDLSPAELATLTGSTKPRRQVVVLLTMGVPFRVGGGQISVKRAVADELPMWEARQNSGPRLDLVR